MASNAIAIRIDTSQMRNLSGRFKSAALHVKPLADLILDRIAHRLWIDVQKHVPLKTGKLANSFYIQSEGKKRHLDSDSTYLEAVVHGTKPHYIRPRYKKALWWPELSHPIPYVGPPMTRIHPGTQANPFLDEAIAELEQELDGILDFFADGITFEVTA